MPNTLIRDAAARAVNLTPFDAGTLKGEGVYVLTPPQTIPARFQDDQRARTEAYCATTARLSPPYAPRYIISSNGTPIVWVTCDGRMHHLPPSEATPAARRHLEMLLHSMPRRFALSEH